MATPNRKKTTLERKAISLVTPEELSEERVVLFSIDDVDYSVPTRARPNLSLKFMRTLRNEGEQIATAYLMEAMLGVEGWEALCDFDALTEDQLTEIMEIVQEIAMGGAEKATKN